MNDLFDLPNTEADDRRPSRMDKRELAARRKRAAKRRKASLVATLIAVLIVGAGIVFAWNTGSKFFAGLNPISSNTSSGEEGGDYPAGSATEAVDITVNEGDIGSKIAATLVSEGVIKSTQAYSNAAAANPDSSRIQPGTYRLYKAMPAAEAIEMLLDLKNIVGNRIQVIPGKRVEDIKQDIKKVTGLSDDQIKAAMDDTKARGLPDVAEGSYEGWLADGDYRFDSEVDAETVIEQMVSRTIKRLKKLDLPESEWQDTLRIASIVQSEGKEKYFADVSSVIHNRLANGWRLEMDSTVHYKFGTRANATTTAAERADLNDWNTYKITGLPITPISAPSLAAVEAAINPSTTDYMFFVTVDLKTGETNFATTLDEHNVNVELFRKYLRENADG